MKKIVLSNCKFSEADFVVLGIPDESGSLAPVKGASAGPKMIRESSYRSYFEHPHGSVSYEPEKGEPSRKVFDFGDIKKKDIEKTVKLVLAKRKVPCFIGGDHSLTYHILKAYKKKAVSLVYFDAHPDSAISEEPAYDTVVYKLKNEGIINIKKSAMVGIRAADPQENENLKEWGVTVIRSNEIEAIGVKNALDKIRKAVSGDIYLSIDMDCLDPAFAPGVSTAEPGGMSSRELLYMAREIASWGIIGFDIMETTPKADINGMTSYLAFNLIREIIANCKT